MRTPRFSSIILLTAMCATLAWPQVPLNSSPSRVVGQPQLSVVSTSPNLVEGRELYSPRSIALDTSLSPPAIYVADTGNNRVLAWRNASAFESGAPADLVIGQRDKYTTLAKGPGTTLSTGLSTPTGLAVWKGALWVVDTGNNRVLRFPTPFSQADQVVPDLVVGQPNFTSNAANQGNSAPSEKTLAFTSGTAAFPGALAFDTAGNLYVTDPVNLRVLRFPANSLAANNPAADLVLGQIGFDTLMTPITTASVANMQVKNQFGMPAGLGFDAAGRLYVSDSALNRVLVFVPPLFTGASAKRVMGVVLPAATGQTAPGLAVKLQYQMSDPAGVAAVGNYLLVADSGNNRILVFDSFDQWAEEATTEPTSFSPKAKWLLGQTDPTSQKANGGQPRPGRQTFSSPTALAFGPGNAELFVADSGNHRVLVLPYANGLIGDATRVLGQDRMDTGSPNLLEGREFRFISGATLNAGIALDTRSDPPRLYVADPYNHRVLGFRDARNVKPGTKADIVLGQPDMQTSMCNYPNNDVDRPTSSSLCQPIGVAVDTDGNLFVADANNGRVLRFPTPFARQTQLQAADLVLGQSSFTTKITDPSARNMAAPYGLAFLGTAGLLVSDASLNRVLYFERDKDGQFSSGMAASKVFGQKDFTSIEVSTSGSPEDNRFRVPAGVSTDVDGRTYVADSGNNRVLIFDTIGNISTYNARAAATLSGVSSPRAVFVNPQTGEIWVTDTGNSKAHRYLRYDQLPINKYQPKDTITAPSYTLAAAQDQYGSLFLADATNRVAIYYPGVTALNGASYLAGRPLAPGTIASLFPATSSTRFGTDSKSFTELPNPLPVPTTLADIQVTVADLPAPLFYVSPGQINFVVPKDAPESGTAEVLVTRPSTGQILGAGQIAMDVAAPALFTADANGSGQAAVINADGTVNSAANPAVRGTVISIYATGCGKVSGAPADGVPASGAVPTTEKPRVLIGTCWTDDSACTGEADAASSVQYSGLAPGLVGVWQINVRIPSGRVSPVGQQALVVQFKSRYSNGATSTSLSPLLSTTIMVKLP